MRTRKQSRTSFEFTVDVIFMDLQTQTTNTPNSSVMSPYTEEVQRIRSDTIEVVDETRTRFRVVTGVSTRDQPPCKVNCTADGVSTRAQPWYRQLSWCLHYRVSLIGLGSTVVRRDTDLSPWREWGEVRDKNLKKIKK